MDHEDLACLDQTLPNDFETIFFRKKKRKAAKETSSTSFSREQRSIVKLEMGVEMRMAVQPVNLEDQARS